MNAILAHKHTCTDGHVINGCIKNSWIDGGGVVNETTVSSCLTECPTYSNAGITISYIKYTGIINEFKGQ